MKTYYFSVKGSSHFPLDMLRYDACYPADNDSVARLIPDQNMTTEERRNFAQHPRVIYLRSQIGSPTRARWNSFGWQVIEERIVK